MKPRLKLIRGIWHCSLWLRSYPRSFKGVGYTPAQAYDDWKAHA